MGTLQQYFEFAQLSQAAYARLDSFETLRLALEDEDGSQFSHTQANYFINSFAVLDSSANSNDPAGFSATLFQNVDTNEITLAIRGTEPGFGPDLVDADVDIGLYGAAFEQIVSLYNYWQRLITPAGEAAEQLV